MAHQVAGSSIARLASGRWRSLPSAPIVARTGAATVWSGHELLVWSGDSGDQADTLLPDGAGYDPAADRWRLLPPAPIAPRTSMTSIWTGREFIVWGGYDHDTGNEFHVTADGAAYDPATNRWRTIAPSPLTPRAEAVGVWTGTELIVLGGHPAIITDEVHGDSDAAAYDPVRDRWRRLPAALPVPAGQSLYPPSAVWTDTSLLVWWPWAHAETQGNTTTGTVGYDLFRYDPGTDHWELLPSDRVPGDPNTPAGISDPVWTGHEVLIPGSGPFRGPFHGGPSVSEPLPYRYDPKTNHWSQLAGGPGLSGQLVWTGQAVLLVAAQQFPNSTPCSTPGPCGPPGVQTTINAWDPSTATWTQLPSAPDAVPPTPAPLAVYWTGADVLVWGTTPGGGAGAVRPVAFGLRFGPS